MRRRLFRLLLSAALVVGAIGATAPSVFAAGITCTSGMSGFYQTARNVFFTPPPMPSYEAQGHSGLTHCSDGVGTSQQFNVWEQFRDSEGRPSAVNSEKLRNQSGDGCGLWDDWGPVTLYNLSTFSYTTSPWHWQPVLKCGMLPQYQTANQSWGTVTKTNVFIWSWQIQWG